MYSNCVTLLNRDFVLILAVEYVGHFTALAELYGFWNISKVECLDDEEMIYFGLLGCDIA
jgi:hypothetical protein